MMVSSRRLGHVSGIRAFAAARGVHKLKSNMRKVQRLGRIGHVDGGVHFEDVSANWVLCYAALEW